jgi:hypothetical protein
MSNTFNFNATNQQNQIGDNNTQNMTVEGGLSLEGFLKGIENAFLPEPDDVALEDIVAGPQTAMMNVLSDIRTAAYEAEEKQVEPEQAKTVLERFTQMVATSGPKIRKALLAFATTTASAYLGENPIVQGVLAAINAVQES